MKKRKRIRKQITCHTRIVTREEEPKIIALLQEAPHGNCRRYYPEIADLVIVLVDTGMRLGEALMLDYEDIDFEENLITVRMAKTDRHRRVPMTTRVAVVMKRRQESEPQKPFNLTSDQVQKAWMWVRTQIGVIDSNQLLLHSLRQTCASRLINAGIALDIVEEWLSYSKNYSFRRLAPITVRTLNIAAAMLESFILSHQ